MRASNHWLLVNLPASLILSLGLATLATLASARGAPPPHVLPVLLSPTQTTMAAMNKANAAVVGIRVKAVEDASSALTLGMERTGSGVVIEPDGLILTIGYLLVEAEQIEIVTQDNKILPATAVAYDVATGFGLVKPLLPLHGVTPVKLGSIQDLKPGEPLIAATGATTDGQDGDVSTTRLISTRAFTGNWEYHIDTALFTSPPVSAGSGNHSGAPLFNLKGEVVGIGSLLVMDASGENRRLPGNMFVPVDLLKPVLSEMKQSGRSRQSYRPWLGLTSTDQSGEVQIVRISANSPAENAGLQVGEVVLAVDGKDVTTLESFYKMLWVHTNPDEPVSLTLRSEDDEVKVVVLTPEDRMSTLKKPAGI